MKSLTSSLKARSPCLPSLCSILIAATVPSLRIPLYTTPNTPCPITFASLNFSVATSSSLYENTWTAPPPPLLYLLGAVSISAGVLSTDPRESPPWRFRHPPFTSATFSHANIRISGGTEKTHVQPNSIMGLLKTIFFLLIKKNAFCQLGLA